MDGLLGGNQLGTLGLLGLDPEEINRARGQAQSDMYFALASQLLSGGPTGASIAKGLQMGQKAYRDALSEQTAERLQQVKIQDYLRQQQEAQAAKARQAQADRIIGRFYQPATTEYQRMTPQQLERAAEPGFVVPQTTTPARFDLSSAAPLLMAIPEGRKALTDIIGAQKAMRPETFTLAEGATQFERDPITGQTRQIATGAPKEKATPGEIQGYNLARSQGYTGTFLDYQTALKKAGAGSTTVNMPTGEERKSAVLANRMNFSVGQMNEAIGRDPTAAMPKTLAEAARFFTGSEFLANKLTPEQRQIVESAQLDVLDAALTLGTGAAYTREQLEGYRKSYFPQLGDSEKTIQSKQKRLENILQSAQIASGRAVQNITTKIPPAFDIPSQSAEIPSGVVVRKRQ